MKKMTLVSIGMVSAMLMLAGCFTRAIAYTKTNPDGTKESCVSILGTGDKVSQVARAARIVEGGEKLVIVAGMPPGIEKATNSIRVHTIPGDRSEMIAAYSSSSASLPS